MATTQHDILIRIKTEAEGNGVAKADDQAKGFSNTLKGLVAGGLLAAVGQQLLAFGRDSLQASSDVQEMQSKFDIVFSEVGDKVARELDQFAEAASRSRYELREMASTLGDTLKPMGFSQEAAGDFSVQLTQLATDLSSFNNMPMDEALQRLQGTLIGSHENALAFGVIINENTLKAELAANGWDKLTGAQLEQAKVQARINLLTKGTTDAQGDAIRTSDGYANQQRALAAAMEELQVTLGTALLPLMTDLVGIAKEAAEQLNTAAGALGGYADQVEDIVEKNNAAATSMEDLVEQGKRIQSTYEDAGTLGRLATGTNQAFADSSISTAIAIAKSADSFEEYEAAVNDAFGGQVEFANILNRSKKFAGETAFTVYELAKAEQAEAEATEQATRIADAQTAVWQARVSVYNDMYNAVVDVDQVTRLANEQILEHGGSLEATSREAEEMAYASGELAGSEEALAAAIERTNERLAAQEAAQAQLRDAFGQSAGPIGDLIAANEAFASGQVGAADQVVAANEAVKQSYIDVATEAILATQGVNEGTLDLLVSIGSMTQEEADRRLEFTNTVTAIEDLTASQEFNKLTTEQQTEALNALIDGQTTTVEGALDAVEAFNEQNAEMEAATTHAETLGQRMEEMGKDIYGANDAVINIADSLAQLPDEVVVTVVVNQIGEVPGAGSAPGFASGGWTGFGGPNELAGFVHKGELVVPGDVLRRGQGAIADFVNRNTPANVIPDMRQQVSGGGAFGGGSVNDNRQYIINNQTSEAAALSMAIVAERRRDRLDTYMGV